MKLKRYDILQELVAPSLQDSVAARHATTTAVSRPAQLKLWIIGDCSMRDATAGITSLGLTRSSNVARRHFCA